MFILNIVFYGCQERVGKIAIFGEKIAILEVDDSSLGGDGGGFGFLSESNESVMSPSEVIIDDIRGGGAKNTGDLLGGGNEAGEAESGIARRVFLIISAFVSFVDNDEAEIVQRG